MIGKKVYANTINKQNRNFSTEINVNDYSKGVYFIELNVNGNRYSSKFVKQ